MSYRKIIHVDMDAFFASVEQRDNPALRGIPLVVGFDGPRGVVSTASYEARPYGIHSAQSIQQAKQRCPHLTIVPPDFSRYKAVSAQVHEIFREYTDMIEPVSIDEAFLDVTENKQGVELAVDIARAIKAEIFRKTSLTASAGVSYCKFLAKIASDWRKPDGLCTVHPDAALDFIAKLPVEKFWGIGEKTAQKQHAYRIFTGQDLRDRPPDFLTKHFGKMGQLYYNYARGIDDSPVVTEHERKSLSCERTFATDISGRIALVIELYHATLELVGRLAKNGFEGYTLTLKIKYADFTQISRSVTSGRKFLLKDDILPAAKQLLEKVDTERPVRLIGLGVSNPEGNADHFETGTLSF